MRPIMSSCGGTPDAALPPRWTYQEGAGPEVEGTWVFYQRALPVVGFKTADVRFVWVSTRHPFSLLWVIHGEEPQSNLPRVTGGCVHIGIGWRLLRNCHFYGEA